MGSALRRYNAALDDAEWDASFLKLWSLLEFLTGTATQTSKHTETVKRASILWAEPDYSTKVLDMLRINRNKHVHHSVELHNAEASIYSLNRYVENLLTFHLWNRLRFSSLNAAAEFLSLPPDHKTLVRKRTQYQNAIRFHPAPRR